MEDTKEKRISDEYDEEERGLPSVNRRRTGGNYIIPILFICFIGLALFAVNGGFSSKKEDSRMTEDSDGVVEDTLPPLPPLPAPPKPIIKKEPIKIVEAEAPPLPPPPKKRPRFVGKEKKELTPSERKRQSGVMSIVKNKGRLSDQRQASDPTTTNFDTGSNSGGFSQFEGGTEEMERADSLANRLGPTKLDGSRASLIVDRSRIITKGTFLDCALETALSSDVPGMTSCILTRDVMSTNGKFVMLEGGSKIVGEYKSNLKRGQVRLFVLWTRIETPNGVIINLDSPGTDALGRSGHSGFLDTHFWERFGSAIMLSLVDDIGAYVASSLADNTSGGNNIQFGSTSEAAQNAASIAVENSINIPPTLVKNQGDHINVFVARDLDFRGVYGIAIKD